MNDNDESNVPNVPPPITPNPNFEVSPSLPPPKPNQLRRPLLWWLRKFFACNPFYLASAALLIYGCYRISIDGTFIDRETTRLLFNFSSVQVYELLLVGVAIFLARRCLWYDSMVLVGLENMLVFVPFILLSAAALTGPWITGLTCATGVILAVLRFGGLKRYFAELNLPGSLLGVGFILLALNVALPLTYRHYIDFKIGTDLPGPDYTMNECMWLMVLPAALALVNFLPPAQSGGDFLPQRRWLPTGIFALWVSVTGVHLWALDWIYGYYLRPDLFAPAGWVLAWTVFLRLPAPATLKYALIFPPIVVPFLADTPGTEKIYLTLMALNVAAFGVMRFLRGGNRFARHLAGHLAYASAVLFVAGLPANWIQLAIHGATATGCVVAGLTAYVIFWAALLRNPKLALLGAILFGITIAVVFHRHSHMVNWALQGSFVFFLLHSLRWNDAEHTGAAASRNFIGIIWAIQSFVWMNCEGARFWMPFIPGLLVFALYCVLLPCRGVWRLFAVPASALAVVLSGPSCLAIDRLRSAPVGLLAVIASFLFLGFGTIAALTREFWHHHEYKTERK